MKFVTFYLCVFSFMVSNGYAACANTYFENNIIKEKNTSSEPRKQRELFEFKFTDEELIELSKWKDKSFEDLWNDAFKSDRAALYLIGMSLLTGSTGLTIDVQKADLCFVRSASFGFGPALKQIIHKNIEEENLFLVLIYSNLMTSLGHSEYIAPYHELRTNIIDRFGNGVSKEIERIASCKKVQIDSNIEKLEKSKDRDNFFLEMLYYGTLIDHQDKEFNDDYWFRFTKFQVKAQNEGRLFEDIINNHYPEFEKIFEKSKENVKKCIDNLRNNKPLSESQLFLKEAKKGIGKADNFIILMESFQNASNDNLRKLTKEFLLLCQNAKGVLEQHCNFFLSPQEFVKSDKCMKKLAEYTAGVSVHKENIGEILKELNNNDG